VSFLLSGSSDSVTAKRGPNYFLSPFIDEIEEKLGKRIELRGRADRRSFKKICPFAFTLLRPLEKP
jgi:hypothetical protein